MKVRPARIPDAPAICDVINFYAERGKMLHRSLENIYESLREFLVADDHGSVVGCVAVDIVWADLAEIKSLAVRPEFRSQGVGRRLMDRALRNARALGIGRLFALTYEREFFGRWGFEVVDRQKLPEKVWRECIACPKANACDEIAMMLCLNGTGGDAPSGPAESHDGH